METARERAIRILRELLIHDGVDPHWLDRRLGEVVDALLEAAVDYSETPHTRTTRTRSER